MDSSLGSWKLSPGLSYYPLGGLLGEKLGPGLRGLAGQAKSLDFTECNRKALKGFSPGRCDPCNAFRRYLLLLCLE